MFINLKIHPFTLVNPKIFLIKIKKISKFFKYSKEINKKICIFFLNCTLNLKK